MVIVTGDIWSLGAAVKWAECAEVSRPVRTKYGAGRTGFCKIFHGRLPKGDSIR